MNQFLVRRVEVQRCKQAGVCVCARAHVFRSERISSTIIIHALRTGPVIVAVVEMIPVQNMPIPGSLRSLITIFP